MIDAKEGRVAYAVLSFGGFMGMGKKLFAMPWRAFEFATTENTLIHNGAKAKLTAAPGFDQDAKWPDFADRTWGNSIYKYYGYDPSWKEGIMTEGKTFTTLGGFVHKRCEECKESDAHRWSEFKTNSTARCQLS